MSFNLYFCIITVSTPTFFVFVFFVFSIFKFLLWLPQLHTLLYVPKEMRGSFHK